MEQSSEKLQSLEDKLAHCRTKQKKFSEIVETGQNLDSEVAGRMGGKKKKHEMRRNWSWRSGSCEQEEVAEAATRRSLRMGAASIQPSCQHGSSTGMAAVLSIIQGELSRVFGVKHQPAPTTPVHQVPEGQSANEQPMEGTAGEWGEEQRKSANREYGSLAPAGRNQGFLAASGKFPKGLCRRR